MESETELTTKVEYKGRSYFIKTDQGIDLSLKNNFDNKNPIFFKAKQSSLNPVQIGGFKGDIKQGGSCNVGIASIDIHCTGTHTECISHVSESETKIVDVCPRSFIPSQLISLKPDHISNTSDSYHDYNARSGSRSLRPRACSPTGRAGLGCRTHDPPPLATQTNKQTNWQTQN